MTDIETLVRRADPVGPPVSSDDDAARHLCAAVLAGTAVPREDERRGRPRVLVAMGAAGLCAAALAAVIVVAQSAAPDAESGQQPATGPFVAVTPWSDVQSAGPVPTPRPFSGAEKEMLAAGRPTDPTSIDCFATADLGSRIDGIVATGGNPVEGCASLIPTWQSAGVPLPSPLKYDAQASVCVLWNGALGVFPAGVSCRAAHQTRWAGAYSDEDLRIITAWVTIMNRSVYDHCVSLSDLTSRIKVVYAATGLQGWTVTVGQLPADTTSNNCYAVMRPAPLDKTMELWPTSQTMSPSPDSVTTTAAAPG